MLTYTPAIKLNFSSTFINVCILLQVSLTPVPSGRLSYNDQKMMVRFTFTRSQPCLTLALIRKKTKLTSPLTIIDNNWSMPSKCTIFKDKTFLFLIFLSCNLFLLYFLLVFTTYCYIVHLPEKMNS